MSTPLPHIARRATVMRIILAHIGQVMPTSRMIAYDLGCTTGQVDHSIRAMCDAGEIVCIGNGGSRVIVVPGVGETLPRMTGKEVAAYVPRPIELEPARVFNFACPRCGVRNCARHSPAPLITRAAAAMGAQWGAWLRSNSAHAHPSHVARGVGVGVSVSHEVNA